MIAAIPHCPTCAEQGITPERIIEGAGQSTLMYCEPFYDREGMRHFHDMNTTTVAYRCSNGHAFTQVVPRTCWCGWKQKVSP